jgi:tRNA/rRNA methyltransferase
LSQASNAHAAPIRSPGPLDLDRVRIVLVRPSHPGNIGATARAMHTMGLSRLTLVAPRRFPDPEADALATGAGAVLAQALVVGSLDEGLSGCAWTVGLTARSRELPGRVLTMRDAAREAANVPGDGDVGFVFGTEMHGLSNDELARCAAAATIPANPAYPSLNLAAAVQVVAYELRVAVEGGQLAPPRRFAPATHDDLEHLYAHAERTLISLALLDPGRPRRLMPRLRRIFARAALEHEEVNILRGILVRIDSLLRERDGR